MKQRKPPKGRNPIAKVLCTSREVNIRGKSMPNKKGVGSVYSRKGRNDGRSDPYSLGLTSGSSPYAPTHISAGRSEGMGLT